MKIYLLSGLGGDDWIFQNLRFPEGFTTEFVPWQNPEQHENLRGYLQRITAGINTSEPFLLCGVSFGGIAIQEMCHFLKPEKLILISTITDPLEMPLHMKMARGANWKSVVPEDFYKWAATKSAPVVGVHQEKEVEEFKQMVTQFTPYYYKWAIEQISSWEKCSSNIPCLRLHGEKDLVFPIANIRNAIIIPGGEHLMVMHHAEEISARIAEFLQQY